MKGIIFNLLEDALTAEHGADAWPGLIEASGVSGVYTSLGSYPDAEVVALVETGAAVLGQSPGDVLRWLGQRAIPLLFLRFPQLFDGYRDARHFVSSVNTIIHPEVRKLYSGAACPHFHFNDRDDGALLSGYQSQRRLCMLAEGMVVGASDHFGQTVAIEHLACMADGDALCRLTARWNA